MTAGVDVTGPGAVLQDGKAEAAAGQDNTTTTTTTTTTVLTPACAEGQRFVRQSVTLVSASWWFAS